MNTNQESRITLITGSRGSGKTATALRIAEDEHKTNPELNIYIVAYPNPSHSCKKSPSQS